MQHGSKHKEDFISGKTALAKQLRIAYAKGFLEGHQEASSADPPQPPAVLGAVPPEPKKLAAALTKTVRLAPAAEPYDQGEEDGKAKALKHKQDRRAARRAAAEAAEAEEEYYLQQQQRS
jgi:hypothetical protein